jgi:GLPGLI family protein
MKRISILIILLSAVCIQSTFAQKKAKAFTGEINMSITYDGTWDPATLAQQPKSTLILMTEKKSKTEILAGGASISTIANTIDTSSTILINAMGMKFYVKQTKENVLESLAEKPEPKIVYTEETKTIAGYECKKAEYITIDEYDDEVVTVVYYTEAIGNSAMNFGGQFHGLKGFPMEYTMQTEEGKITFTVTSLKAKKIKDTVFLIPTDYEEMTPEMLKQMGG